MSADPLPVQVQERPPRWSVYLYHRPTNRTTLWSGHALTEAHAERRARYAIADENRVDPADLAALWSEVDPCA